MIGKAGTPFAGSALDSLLADVEWGSYEGLHSVGDVSCHHLLFRQENIDWQLWIDAGEKPVPRRITIDYRQDYPRSRYSANFAEWNEAPTFTEQAFEFKPPAGTIGIEISKTNR